MRKILTHPVVLLLMVIAIATILLTGSKKVSGFSWFAQWTTTKNKAIQKNDYVQGHLQNDFIQDVMTAHTKLSAVNFFYWDLKVWNVSTVPQYLASAQRLLMIDIVSYLENSSDKEAWLDSLVAQMTYYQTQGATIQSNLQGIIQEKTLQLNTCTSQKEDGDRNFYQWLKDWDANTMTQWLAESQKAGTCQASARIDVNAHTVMLNRVNDIVTTLTNLSSILTENHATIIANFPLFKDTYLEKLISLRDELRARSPGTN